MTQTPEPAYAPTVEEIRQGLYRILTLVPHHTEGELHERFALVDYLLSQLAIPTTDEVSA